MSAVLAAEKNVTPNEDKTIAYQLRCKESWMERIRIAAQSIGLSPASYVRMILTKQMDADGIPQAKPIKPIKRRPSD